MKQLQLADEGLLRGMHAVQLQRADAGDKAQHLIMYVLFSATLFDVGHVLENRTIIISGKQGDFIRDWHPCEGAIQTKDGYYKNPPRRQPSSLGLQTPCHYFSATITARCWL